MSELAFNINGEPFDVPANAVGWRVRRMKQKGAPEVVYGRNGIPLIVPLEAELEDVRFETGAPGRYRLDPVDDTNRPIPGAPAGYVYLHEERGTAAAPVQETRTQTDSVVIEAMRMNADISKLVIEKFPMMIEAAAGLLRAADGAGLPARPGMVLEVGDHDDDDDEDESDGDDAPESGLTALLGMLAPVLSALSSGAMKMPDLASLVSWPKAAAKGVAARQAKAKVTASAAAPRQEAAEEAESADEPTAEQQLMADPAALQHFLKIMGQLTPDEATLARTLANELSASERKGWFNELKAQMVPEAVQKIRALLVAMDKKGGAS